MRNKCPNIRENRALVSRIRSTSGKGTSGGTANRKPRVPRPHGSMQRRDPHRIVGGGRELGRTATRRRARRTPESELADAVHAPSLPQLRDSSRRGGGHRPSPLPVASPAGVSGAKGKSSPAGDRQGETTCEGPPGPKCASTCANRDCSCSPALGSIVKSLRPGSRTAPRRSISAEHPGEGVSASLMPGTTANGTSTEVVAAILAASRLRTAADAGRARAVPHPPQRRSKSQC